jgi:hypothetical protein
MRLTVAVFSLFISIIVFSQEDEALNFEEGVELAHFNIWIVSTIVVTIISGIFIVKFLKKTKNKSQ